MLVLSSITSRKCRRVLGNVLLGIAPLSVGVQPRARENTSARSASCIMSPSAMWLRRMRPDNHDVVQARARVRQTRPGAGADDDNGMHTSMNPTSAARRALIVNRILFTAEVWSISSCVDRNAPKPAIIRRIRDCPNNRSGDDLRRRINWPGLPAGTSSPASAYRLPVRSGAFHQIPRPYVGMTTFENLLVAAAVRRRALRSRELCVVLADPARLRAMRDKANRIGGLADAARPQAAGTGAGARFQSETSASGRDRRRPHRRGRQGPWWR